MPSLPDSSWSYAALEAEYLDTLQYDLAGDVALAQRFIAACRALLLLRPTESQKGPGRIKFDAALLAEQLRQAENWLRHHRRSTTGGVYQALPPSFH